MSNYSKSDMDAILGISKNPITSQDNNSSDGLELTNDQNPSNESIPSDTMTQKDVQDEDIRQTLVSRNQSKKQKKKMEQTE